MNRSIALSALLLSTLAAGCYRGGAQHSTPATAKASATSVSTCRTIGPHVLRFGEVLEDAGESTKGRLVSYAGMLELLLTFERAAIDLQAQLSAVQADDAQMRDAMKSAIAAVGEANEFARTSRVRVEKTAEKMAPLAKESDTAYRELRAACPAPEAKTPAKPGRKGAPKPKGKDECAAIDEVLAKFATVTFAEHVAVADELAQVPVTSPTIAQARDRAVAATKAVAKVSTEEQAELAKVSKAWVGMQKAVGKAFDTLSTRCKDAPLDVGQERFVADAKPDPRKLTVLVRVKPPSGIEGSLEQLASNSSDERERAFYQARAKGAFGSGFVLVRSTPSGGSEQLVITNRHVVELSDRASLELADGTSLGPAEIVYTDDLHDVAVLRPTQKLGVEKGFAFAVSPAKDQQGVVATGFPGMAGRPSYQTTRGYISNESFKLDEGTRSLTYVQHTAPIDPGSSGGPLTDERGNVLGLNTLKVTNREAVALAVPSSSILETIRRADAAEARHASATHHKEGARLACLGFVGELAAKKPRMVVLESMISNELTGEQGLAAAGAFADDEAFGQLWQNDSVRAMRIATMLRVQNSVALAGGASAFETCTEAQDAPPSKDEVRYRIRLANWETRDIAVKWEQGHWKIGHVEMPVPATGFGMGGLIGGAQQPEPTKPAKKKPAAKKKK